MHIMYMYMLCFCTLCSYATYEWPEFYINKDMFCSVGIWHNLLDEDFRPQMYVKSKSKKNLSPD